jgi:secreted trypsin-like serine protease
MRSLFALISIFTSLSLFAAHSDKVISGVATDNSHYPWQVSLQTRFGSHFCGGIIIDKTTILTAAHCVIGTRPKDVQIHGGSTDGSLKRLKRLERVREVIVHPDFRSKKVVAHDIALLKTRRAISFNDKVKAAELPRSSQFPFVLQEDFKTLSGKMVITGWGKTNTGGRLPIPSDQLMEGELKGLGSSTVDLFKGELRDYLLQAYELEDSTIDYLQSDNSRTLILEGLKNGTSPCGGDSGGPITYFSKNGPLVIGISSYVAGGDGPCKAIAGATDIQAYLDWIDSL